MAPNLYLAARKLVNPCEWFKFSSDNSRQYHYKAEPVPGIYATLKGHGTYIYAIRPNGRKDSEKIFGTHPGFDYQAKEDTMANAPSTTSEGTTATPKSSIDSTTQTTLTNSTGSSNRSRSISIIINQPSQKSPLRKCNNSSSTSLSSLPENDPNVTRIKSVDFGGFKYLRQPLKVEYNDILQRWMFSTEVRTRKIVTEMCAQRTCMETDPRVCGNTVRRQLFALDDGMSWIVVGDVKHGRTRKSLMARVGKDEMLYCIDERTGWLRRQNVRETRLSRWRLAIGETKILMDDDEADYMAVMRYLGGEKRI